MSKELVISANRHETRVAIVEDDQVVEVYHQRENEYSLAGSIHKGRVTRVLPGMQSAFVDIGLDRDAFLYVSDFFEDNEEYDKIVTSVEEKVLKLDRPQQQGPAPLGPVATPPAETPEPEEVRDASPASSAPIIEAAPPAAPLSASGQDPRRDDRDRDRRGHRSRRRRGQKGGGRLPDSKYYSPGPRGTSENETAARVNPPEPVPEPLMASVPEPVVETARIEDADDFFVLPGESLAKYTRPGSEEGEDGPHGEVALEAEPHQVRFETAEPEDDTRRLEAQHHGGPVEDYGSGSLRLQGADAAVDRVSEIAAEPPAEPQPELAAAVEIAEDAAVEAARLAAPPPIREPQAEKTPPVEVYSAETAEDVDVIPTDSAEPEASEGVEAAAPVPEEHVTEETRAEEAEPGEPRELGEPGEPAEAVEAADSPAEEEGPEPARIPTSLTATLREQDPRYLHRVSRRMRRRGRDNRGGPMGDIPRGSGQGGAPEPRPHEPGPRSAPEPRIAPAPPSAAAATPSAPRPEKAGAPSISDLLREGQEIIVQIAKEPLGQKGARITSHIALPGRFLVYMPTVDHIGVSRKIPSDEERSRLKRILQSNRTGISGGYIVRTAGEGRSEEELRADMMFLYNMWLDMRQKAERRPAPLLIHHDLNVVERVLRDQLTSAFKSIWVDNEEEYESVLRFVQRFQPPLVNRVKMYTRATPIFEEFGITAELEKALRPKVWLKSGGYIVINQTEALVAIDVNTGKFVGKSNRLEDTIVRTNTDAIKEIVRQIRLRDLGGIIVVDFIDMDERKNRQKVMQALEEAMRADRAPYKILQFNDFGLVAITRKRVKQSLERTLCTPCPYCEGAGYVKSAQTVVGEILQEAHKISKGVEGKDVMLRVAPEVAKVLKSNQNTYLQELEEILGRTVMIKSDPQLHLEKFDLA
ncbi:MAG: Rne/Rng family ribonuclease [Acidobacteriia bacterium]|nr:Rne/Rng family ribonuclease [Terriglobia bacterium]